MSSVVENLVLRRVFDVLRNMSEDDVRIVVVVALEACEQDRELCKKMLFVVAALEHALRSFLSSSE